MPSHKSNTNRYVTQLGGQERYYLEKYIAWKKSELSNLELERSLQLSLIVSDRLSTCSYLYLSQLS